MLASNDSEVDVNEFLFYKNYIDIILGNAELVFRLHNFHFFKKFCCRYKLYVI